MLIATDPTVTDLFCEAGGSALGAAAAGYRLVMTANFLFTAVARSLDPWCAA